MPTRPPLYPVSAPQPGPVAHEPPGHATDIRVLPAEIRRHGPAAAIVLARIRYRCAVGGPDCIERDGHLWWRVSHAQLGYEVGLTDKQTRSATNRLEGAIVTAHFPPMSNQSRAYRVGATHE